MTVTTVQVELSPPHAVHVGAGALELARAHFAAERARFVISDARVEALYGGELAPAGTARAHLVPEGEQAKTFEHLQRTLEFLAREGMQVLDRSGKVVDPATIDFGRWTARSFPYVFRHEPGPRNALGRIKLLFPNPYDVYLHDTPARSLFARELRTFSHGCIRVEEPVQLAEIVLADPAWTEDRLEAAIAAGDRSTIRLRRPIEVIVQYWTASADPDGVLHYYRDTYGRDDALLAALDG